MLTVPPKVRVIAEDLSMSDPLLIVAGPAMTTLFARVKAVVEIRLSVAPALRVTEPEPSEVATVPTSSVPASIVMAPERPALALVRMRLPPPCLRKPLVPVSAELMTVLAKAMAPSPPPLVVRVGVLAPNASVSPLPRL